MEDYMNYNDTVARRRSLYHGDPVNEAKEMLKRCIITETDCYIYISGNSKQKYAYITFNGKTELAHRFVYKHLVQDIPAKLKVCHICDTQKCINPAHLLPGTQAMNVQDCVLKGRFRSHGKYISPQDKDYIFSQLILGTDYKTLALELNVSSVRIGQIARDFGIGTRSTCM